MNTDTLDPAILAGQFDTLQGTWSTGLKVGVEVDSEEKEYFLKVVEQERFVEMSRAEYEGQKALATYIPDNVCHPVAWGYFENDTSKSFFVTEFRYLRARSPPPSELLAILKILHQSSISPTGLFGFHVTTYYGPPPMINDWTDNWEEYFTRLFRANMTYAQQERGKDSELEETGGRIIKPTLCHGDLWDGNIQIDVETKQPILFDSCCFYGHNEMDLQCMGDPRYALSMEFIDMYKNEVGASEPQEDFYDRHDLYAIRNNICTAGMWPQWAPLLQTAREAMRRLLAKHPQGLDGFQADQAHGTEQIL
ncbi:hypothetical protein DL768_008589 [Monosporascus sp. mg162]|nr:hypothetical protein DL768_008589 [Monosporascus sp. mg162]